MKKRVVISKFAIRHVGHKFVKLVKKSGLKLLENKLIARENIVYFKKNGSEIRIDPTCNGLNPDDENLKDIAKKLKCLICLDKIDSKLAKKELLSQMELFEKTYAYLRLNEQPSIIQEIDSLDPTNIQLQKILPKKFTASDILECFLDIKGCNWYMDKKQKKKPRTLRDIILSKPDITTEKLIYKQATVIDKFIPYFIRDQNQRGYFEHLFFGSISLDYDEKLRIIKELPTLSEFQIKKLIQVWEEEKLRFLELEKEDPSKIKELFDKNELVNKRVIKHIQSLKYSSPQKICDTLKESVIGQDDVLKELSIILYYHAQILQNSDLKLQVMGPVLLAGSTGVGKTLIVKESAKLINVPYLHVDCSTLVSEGIVGYGINDIIKDILRVSAYDESRAQHAIVFFDEFDKLLLNHSGTSILTQILRIIEGHKVSIVKTHATYEEFVNNSSLNTENILFIFGGSFEHIMQEKRQNSSGFLSSERADEKLNFADLASSGFPRELLGRIKKVFFLNDLDEDDFFKILKESHESPIKNLRKILKMTQDVDVNVSDGIMKVLANRAASSHYGARRLQQLSYELFENVLYQAPLFINTKYIIDEEYLDAIK